VFSNTRQVIVSPGRVRRDTLRTSDKYPPPSHIGRNHEQDIGHLADIVKRHRSSTDIVLCDLPHSDLVLQSSPTGVASLKFTNLLSRLLDQVSFRISQICKLDCILACPLKETRDNTLPTVSSILTSPFRHFFFFLALPCQTTACEIHSKSGLVWSQVICETK